MRCWRFLALLVLLAALAPGLCCALGIFPHLADERPCIAGNDSYTKLLIHSNAEDGGKSFTDSSSEGHTLTGANDLQHDTSTSVFWDTSIYFDGTNDYLTIADSADWDFSSGDFTIDFWICWDASYAARNYVSLFAPATPTSDNHFEVYFGRWDGDARITVGWRKAATCQLLDGAADANLNTSYSMDSGTWYHIEICRSGDDFHIFLDGELHDTCTSKNASEAIGMGHNAVTMGSDTVSLWDSVTGGALGEADFMGWIEEFRVSKGIARHTENFTPPDRAYCDDH